jgi:hypothetical protein
MEGVVRLNQVDGQIVTPEARVRIERKLSGAESWVEGCKRDLTLSVIVLSLEPLKEYGVSEPF